MLVFIIRRFFQSIGVLLIMSLLVFLGVYAIGNPIDILISADATQIERARVIAAFGLDQPLWQQYWLFLQHAAAGDMGRSFVYGTSAMGLILERLPATLELAAAAMLLSVVFGIPLGIVGRPAPRRRHGKDHHGLVDTGLLAADLLGRTDADHAVCRHAWLAADRRTRRDRHAVRHSVRFPDAGRPPASAAARVQSGAVQYRVDHPSYPRRRPGSADAGLRPLRPRQGPAQPAHYRRACAEKYFDSHRDRGGAAVRRDHRVFDRDRDDLRLAGRGQIADRFDPSCWIARSSWRS